MGCPMDSFSLTRINTGNSITSRPYSWPRGAGRIFSLLGFNLIEAVHGADSEHGAGFAPLLLRYLPRHVDVVARDRRACGSSCSHGKKEGLGSYGDIGKKARLYL